MTRILGIDPGFGRMGYGVVELQNREWVHVAHGCLETKPEHSLADRLLGVRRGMVHLVEKYQPTAAGVEALFFANNAKTAMMVGQARGIIILTLREHNLPIHEPTPLQVKQALTGYGQAEKEQVQYMVSTILKLGSKKIQDDAADALAIALAVGPLC